MQNNKKQQTTPAPAAFAELPIRETYEYVLFHGVMMTRAEMRELIATNASW